MKQKTVVTTSEAAKIMGVSRRRVIAYIESGQLPAERFGLAYTIQLTDIKRLKRRPAGRPRGIKQP